MKFKFLSSILFLLFVNMVFFTEYLFSMLLQLAVLVGVLIAFYKKEEANKEEVQEDAGEDLSALLDEKEQIIKKLNNRFELAMNASRDGFWDYNLETKEFYLSKTWRKRLGFREDEAVTYLNYIALIPFEERVKYQAEVEELSEEFSEYVEYAHFSFIYPLVTKSGEKLLVEDNGNVFCNENKEVIHFVGFQRVIA